MLQDMSKKLTKEKDVDIKQKDKDMVTEKITEQQVKIAQIVYKEATETYGVFSAVMAFVFDITHPIGASSTPPSLPPCSLTLTSWCSTSPPT